MSKYEIRDVVSDYGIYEDGELKLILNSRSNAEYIKAILEHEERYPNAAEPYSPRVADMSDEECLAVFRICCEEGYNCPRCPLHGDPNGCDYEGIERRVLAIAERAVEEDGLSRAPAPTVEGMWITDEEGFVTCSNCGEEHTWDEFRPLYCDMCGAKMKWEEKANENISD